jgi:ribonuclease III
MSDDLGVAPSVGTQERDAVSLLEGRLGLRLVDREMALAALTHKSYVNEHREETRLVDNERLEFLGDAVIDLAVSHRLMERFPAAREGELSKMRAAVVDEPGLCEMARALDLGQLLRLGRGEELTGGRQKSSLLADAMEAVVAAVFLESGLGPVLTIVDRFLGEAFARATAGTLDRDFKTQLQELAQSRLRSTPRYRVVAERGPDHSKIFEVETELRGEVLGKGTGRSKKDAEQAAAKLALDLLAHRVAQGVPPAPTSAAEPAPAEPLAAAAVLPPASPAEPAGPAEPPRVAVPPEAAPGAAEQESPSSPRRKSPGRPAKKASRKAGAEKKPRKAARARPTPTARPARARAAPRRAARKLARKGR